MNRSYNIVWNQARNMYMVAPELARGDNRIKSKVRSSGLAMSLILLSAGVGATQLGPQSGPSIELENGDTITSGVGGSGISSITTGGSGLQINGKAAIIISGNSGSTGIKLDNSADNQLGTATEIIVTDNGTATSSSTYGIFIDKANSPTNIHADNLIINASGQNTTYAIYAANTKSLIDLGTNSTLNIESQQFAYGLYLYNNPANVTADSLTIRVATAKNSAIGIYASQSNVDLGKNSTVMVSSDAPGASAIKLMSNSTLIADNLALDVSNLVENINGSFLAYGLTLASNSSANMGDSSTINLSGFISSETALSVQGGSTFKANGLNIMLSSQSVDPTFTGVSVTDSNVDLGTGSSISASGFTSGYGIYQYSGFTKADHLTIDVSGNNVYGIQMGGGKMDLGTGSVLSATGAMPTVWINAGNFTADALTVNTQQSVGITAQSGIKAVDVSIGAGSVIDGRNVGENGETSGLVIGYTGSGNQKGVLNFNGTADNRNTIYAVNGYGASAQFSGQTLNIANTDIIMSGDAKNYGLWAIGDYSFTDAGIINGENLTIDMTAAGEAGYGVVVQQGGIVNLRGDTTILANDGVAIWNPKVTNSSNPGAVYQGGTINGSGKMTIEGDIINSGWGYIDLSLDAGSNFEGATSINQDLGPENSSLTIALAASSKWNITSPSSLSTLDNGGQIVFSQDSESGSWSTLDVNKMTLNASSELDVDIAALTSKPLITGNEMTLGGNLTLSGLDGLSLTSDESLTTQSHLTLIDADSALNGNFDSLSITTDLPGGLPDYLTYGGWIDADDNTQYDIGANLSWYANDTTSATPAHGTFTLATGESFNVTQTLADVGPESTTGWDGKTLTKKGDGTLILSGANTYSGGTHIESGLLDATNTEALGTGDIDNSGWLQLDAAGQFALTQNLTTQAGGTTQIAAESTLQVNTLTQKSDSTLDINVDLSATTPIIKARDVNLAGELNISGVTGALTGKGNITLIDAEQPINSDFDTLTIARMPAKQVDFLTVEGRVSRTDATQYDLTIGLAWYANSYNAIEPALGDFTLNDADQSFTLDTVLADVGPESTTEWDGKTLTKKGDGTLILGAVNTYSGATEVEGGALWLEQGAVIGETGSQQNVDIAQNATFGGRNNAVVNANVNNQGNLHFEDSVTINGDVSNAGFILSDSGDESLPGRYKSSDAVPNNVLVINGNYTSQGGSLTLNTQLGDDTSPSDKLIVNGNTAGDTTLYINNRGGEGAQTVQGIEVVDVNGASDGTFIQGNQVQAGLYEYRLYKDAGNWYLRSEAEDNGGDDDGGDGGDNGDGGDSGGGDNPVPPQYRADIGAYLGNQWMARNLQMQTLFDREGSQYRSQDGSIWARFKAGKADSSAANNNVDNNHDYTQFQLGGDVLSWSNGVQSLTLGAMGSYINADTDSTGNRGADGSRFTASGNVSGYNLGLYGTWFADAKTHSGAYVESWYQYGTFDNTVDNNNTGSTQYDSSANAVSLEAGYRYDIAMENHRSLSFTPQAQVVWQNYEADGVTGNNDTSIDAQDSHGWTTRLGLRVDGKLPHGNNIIQPFAEVNWLHDTEDAAVSFDDRQTKMDLPANRAELKAGVEVNIASQWSLKAQATGQTGSDGYRDLNGSLNLRYNW